MELLKPFRKNFKLTLLTIAILISFKGQSQNISWLRQGLHTQATDNSLSTGVATDSLGNIYMVGYFKSSISFGTTTLVSAGNYDIFVAKYDAMGTFQWAKRAGGTADDQAFGIAVSGNSVYITGYIQRTANFNTPSVTGSNEIVGIGGEDIFVAKYDILGTFQWAKRAGGISTDIGYAVSATSSSVYISGTFLIAADFNSPSATGINEVKSAAFNDAFVAKYDASGNFQWVRRGGGTGSDLSYGVSAVGNAVYITGFFGSTANFNNPSVTGSNEIKSTNDLTTDIYIAKYDDAGIFKWAKRAGGNRNDLGYGIVASDNAVYITGDIQVQADFNTPSDSTRNVITTAGGSQDMFVAKYDNNGIFQWAKRAGSDTLDRSIGIALTGNAVYISGYFNKTANFNSPSATGNNEIVSAGLEDIFIAKYDNLGTFKWAKRAGGVASDISASIAVSAKSKLVFTCGVFSGIANFNTPSASGSNELNSTVNLGSAYLAAYSDILLSTHAPLSLNTKTSIRPTITEGVVTVTNQEARIDRISVFNPFGQLILSSISNNQIDLTDLPAGIYLVQVQAGNDLTVKKVFKK
ncbi:MAG: T9SS type A sorting domain-containing protein [Saprospiraceae bacterium]|nr:T9SS type A sorting domain-containing protein [Saprospiraceae bacterium]